MAYQVGLGASENDLEVQGEIDFDFFDNDSSDVQSSKIKNVKNSPSHSYKGKCLENSPDIVADNVRKAIIETTIPLPENYTGNNCGISPPPVEGLQSEPNDFTPQVLCEVSDDSVASQQSSSSSDLSSSFSSEESFEEDEEQTDSMTDVSPLPSHCNSPIVNFGNQNDSTLILHKKVESEEISKPSKQFQKKINVKFSDTAEKNFYNGDSIDGKELLKAIKTLEVTQCQHETKKNETPFLTSNTKGRKNVTFTNEDVRKIDLENQRLLKKIVIQQNRTKPHFSAVYSRPASSAINRQKHQRQIELDNLALLKRLESAKPSKDLRRTKLLNEYDNRSTMSSRASMRRPMSRLSSQISSCRSSARSCGRSFKMQTLPEGRVTKEKPHPSILATSQHKLSINGTITGRNS